MIEGVGELAGAGGDGEGLGVGGRVGDATLVGKAVSVRVDAGSGIGVGRLKLAVGAKVDVESWVGVVVAIGVAVTLEEADAVGLDVAAGVALSVLIVDGVTVGLAVAEPTWAGTVGVFELVGVGVRVGVRAGPVTVGVGVRVAVWVDIVNGAVGVSFTAVRVRSAVKLGVAAEGSATAAMGAVDSPTARPTTARIRPTRALGCPRPIRTRRARAMS